MQPLEQIKNLLDKLPIKDQKIAYKFVNNREFDKLLEIVDSDIYLVSQNLLKEVPKEEYKDIDLDSLHYLKASLMEYMSFIDVEEDIYYDDYL